MTQPLVRAAAAAALAFFVAACSHAGTPPTANASFTVVQQREPRSLNAAYENGASSTEWGELIYQYLVKYDDRGRLVGDAALEVPSLANGGISRDGKTITYRLRPHLTFSDGKPLTAADCAFSVDAINNPRNNVQSRYGYDVVARAEPRDSQTCVLHLKRPFAPILTLVEAPQGFPILPKHLLGALPEMNDAAYNTQPVGSGPFVVDRWSHGDRVEMHANPRYFAGKPKIERLTVRFVPDSNTGINMLRTHDADFYFNDQDYSNYPLLKQLAGYRVDTARVNAVGAIIFNTKDPLTADAAVRHAIAAAIDIPALIARTYRGAVDSEDAGKGLFIWAYDPKAYPAIRYDPAKAKQLLDKAGWTPGADGVRSKGGKKLDILFIIQAGTPGDSVIGNQVTQYLRAVGIAVSLKQFNITQFVAPAGEGGPVYGGKFQMALYPFVNGNDPDTTDQFACANLPPKGYNKSRICDPRIDALLAQGNATFDVTKRKAIYAKLESLLYDELPILLLYQRREMDAATDRLQNRTASVDSAFWNVGGWELK